MAYFCIGILPVNIDNLLIYLPGTTHFGLGIVIASTLLVGTISILFFGYFGEKITERMSRKLLLTITNFIWIVAFGMCAISVNYYYYLIFRIIAAIGTGAFIPLGYSIIGDFYPPKKRGDKFGLLQFGLLLGSGMGMIIGGLLGSYTDHNGWRYAYLFGAVTSLIAGLFYILGGREPERGRAEPEFEDFEGTINYTYKLSFNTLGQIFKLKTILGILLFILFTGIATSTLGTWAIFYLTGKISDSNAGLYATTLYLVAGIGSLPGSILGGIIGDSLYRSGKPRGRIVLSAISTVIGVFFLFGFYLLPFNTDSSDAIMFSWILFLILGFVGNFFASLNTANTYALFSEVSVPELRSAANALNGVMINIGAIIVNTII